MVTLPQVTASCERQRKVTVASDPSYQWRSLFALIPQPSSQKKPKHVLSYIVLPSKKVYLIVLGNLVTTDIGNCISRFTSQFDRYYFIINLSTLPSLLLNYLFLSSLVHSTSSSIISALFLPHFCCRTVLYYPCNCHCIFF